MKKQATTYRIVSSGGYNVVLQDGDSALRIGRLRSDDDFEIQSMFERANGIIALLNKNLEILGPCVMSQSSDMKIVDWDALEDEVQMLLKSTEMFQNYERKVYTQRMEYLNGGTLNSHREWEDAEHILFMLLWFFHVGGAEFGLRHRDLKPYNIMLRVSDNPMTYKFRLGNDTWTITTDVTPVVIDYDFASVFVTNTQTKAAIGTPQYAPIEVQFSQLQRYLKGIHYSSLDCVSYDWWAVGISVVEWLIDPLFKRLDDREELYSFSEYVLDVFGSSQVVFDNSQNSNKYLELLLESFFVTLRLLRYVGALRHVEDTINPQLFEIISHFYDRYEVDRQILRAARKMLNAQPTLRSLIPILLSFNPTHRTGDHILHTHFDYLKGDSKADFTYIYDDGVPLMDLTVFDSPGKRERQIQLVQRLNKAMKSYHGIAGVMRCESCGSPGRFVCSGTGMYYCSKECQK